MKSLPDAAADKHTAQKNIDAENIQRAVSAKIQSVALDGIARVSDEELVSRAQGGCDASMEELCKRYMGVVRARARTYFLSGGETEDLVQEGMIGLFKAVRDYRGGHGTQFKSFATLCIQRQLSTAVKLSLRKKHKPLNSYVSLSPGGGEDDACMDIPAPLGMGPEELVEEYERLSAITAKITLSLSAFERKVLREYLLGKSYSEISAALCASQKSVDNALQRLRRKLASDGAPTPGKSGR